MPSIFDTRPKRAAQATAASISRLRRVSQPKSGTKTSRTQTNTEQTREFQTLLLDDKFPKLLKHVTQSLQNLISPLELSSLNDSKLPFVNYNSIYLALKAAKSRFRKFARNKNTATEREKKLFYVKAIQLLPTLKKIASLQAPKLRSFDEIYLLTENNFLFDFVIADSRHQNPSAENALKQIQKPIPVGKNGDGLRYGLNEPDGGFAWGVFDEKFKNRHEDLQFKIKQVKEGKPSKAKELAGLSTLEIAALSALAIEEKAFHRTLDELVLEPIKELAQSTYLELNKAIGNRARLLSQMNDSDISAEMSRYQLTPKEEKMSMQQLLTRVTRNEDTDVPEVVVVNPRKTKKSKVQPTLKDLIASRVKLTPLETLKSVNHLVTSALAEKQEGFEDQIYTGIMFQVNNLNKNEILEMNLVDNERAYKVLVQIASTLTANGLNKKEVHDALNNLITINSQAIHDKGKQSPTNETHSADAERQKIEKQNVYQVLNTCLDEMIEMANTWTLQNPNQVDSLSKISKGENVFNVSVLKQTKFSSQEIEVLQEKIKRVISSVPQDSHDHVFIRNLKDIDSIIKKQNVFEVLNTCLDEMIGLANTLTLQNINPVNRLGNISRGKDEFKFSVLKKTKFSSEEIDVLQKKISSVISSVPHASRSNNFITNLMDINTILFNQLIKNTSEAIRKENKITTPRQKEATRSDDNLPNVRNPLGEWREAINQLQKVVSRKIDLVKEKLAPLLNKIVQFSRYKKVQEKVPFQSIQDQIFRAYDVFEQKNFNKIPKEDFSRIQDLFLSTAEKLTKMHNPTIAA